MYIFPWQKKKRRLLFDIGIYLISYNNIKPSCKYKKALNRIRNFKPHCVVLSHWHEDHFKACTYGNRELFNCQWIAPDLGNAGINAKRLGIFLYKKGKMMFLDRNKSGEIKIELIKGESELSLYIGKKGKGKSHYLNEAGVAVLHNNMLSNEDKMSNDRRYSI